LHSSSLYRCGVRCGIGTDAAAGETAKVCGETITDEACSIATPVNSNASSATGS
jgi:hypothetical protein